MTVKVLIKCDVLSLWKYILWWCKLHENIGIIHGLFFSGSGLFNHPEEFEAMQCVDKKPDIVQSVQGRNLTVWSSVGFWKEGLILLVYEISLFMGSI